MTDLRQEYKQGIEVRNSSWLLGVRRRAGLAERKNPFLTLEQALPCWAAASSCCITS